MDRHRSPGGESIMTKRRMMNNREIADIFEAVANLMEIKGEAIYRILAYRRAAETLGGLGRDIRDVWEAGELEAIPGVGKAIAGKIDEMISTGRLEFYEKLAAEVPPGLIDVLKVDGVGPKKAARFWKEAGITSLDELEVVAKAGELKMLSGMGAKSEQRILVAIEALRSRPADRHLLDAAWEAAEALMSALRDFDEVVAIEVGGSLRRWRETIGDLDLVAASKNPQEVMKAFVSLPQVSRILGQGDTKTSVELHDGMRVQLWVHPPDRFGSALQYATGSQAHNVKLREIAIKQGLSLSEHGFKRDDGSELLCSEEAMVYRQLGMDWVPPALREDQGELAAAQVDELPELVQEADLRGELHSHTNWSDGKGELEEMIQVAIELGMEYLVISDHSRSLGIANGLSIERLKEQREVLEEVQDKVGEQIHLLHGSEVEILADGSLDYPDEILAWLDIVIASLHTSLTQPRDQVTDRLLNAIRNPHVDVIGHLTGRLIQKRNPADLDVDRILKEGAAHGVVFEINSNAERLDLKDSHARRAIELGCKLAINTDAHHPGHFSFRRYGVGTAQRAWATPQSIVNAWPSGELLKWLKSRG
jgi:DNA polymerase (family 10)